MTDKIVADDILSDRDFVNASTHLSIMLSPPKHWVEFNQTWYMTFPHVKGVREQHYFSLCPMWPLGGQKMMKAWGFWDYVQSTVQSCLVFFFFVFFVCLFVCFFVVVFSGEIKPDIAQQINHMKCQALFSLKNTKKKKEEKRKMSSAAVVVGT